MDMAIKVIIEVLITTILIVAAVTIM